MIINLIGKGGYRGISRNFPPLKKWGKISDSQTFLGHSPSLFNSFQRNVIIRHEDIRKEDAKIQLEEKNNESVVKKPKKGRKLNASLKEGMNHEELNGEVSMEDSNLYSSKISTLKSKKNVKKKEKEEGSVEKSEVEEENPYDSFARIIEDSIGEERENDESQLVGSSLKNKKIKSKADVNVRTLDQISKKLSKENAKLKRDAKNSEDSSKKNEEKLDDEVIVIPGGEMSEEEMMDLFEREMRMAAMTGDIEDAEGIVEALGKEGLKMNQIMYEHLMSVYSRKGDLNSLRDIIEKASFEGIHVSPSMHNNLLYLMANGGFDKELPLYFEGMRKPTTGSFNIMLRFYSLRGNLGALGALIDRMILSGIRPNTTTYNIMLESLVDDFEKAESIMDEMQKNGVEGDSKTFYLLGKIFIKAGRESQGKNLLELSLKMKNGEKISKEIGDFLS